MITICVDFDGTIVDHRYPDIGAPVPGAIEWMKRWQQAGATLVLWTMRSGNRKDGTDPLADAIEYCKRNGVEFCGHNYTPGQEAWTSSPKAYAHIYVDDAAFGCPLRENPRMGGRPFVDWDVVGPAVFSQLLTKRRPHDLLDLRQAER